MTFDQFSPMFATLAMQLRAQDADTLTAKSYFKALADLEPELVAMAAETFALTAEWFPKTSEWRAAALAVEQQRIEQQRALLRRRPRPLCLACDDTGWDRTQDDRVVPCDCRKQRRLEVLGRRPMPEVPQIGDGA